MDMKIIQDTKNEVLKRRELIAEAEVEKVPSKDEVRKKLAALAQADEKALIIEKIESGFGNPKIKVIANAYDSAEAMKEIEQKHFIKRNFKEEVKKEAEEVSEEAPKAEGKSEEKKE